jgi:hypothetical protein
MLNFLKKIFQKQEQEIEEVKLSELLSWLEQKTDKLEFNSYLKHYFTRISKLKEELIGKIEQLSKSEVSKEYKNTEERVKNIVKGHRDQYVKEISRFTESLVSLEKKDLRSLEYYQKTADFNKEINQKIESTAKRTAKSYQATQHLFFKDVEEVFKSMGEINLLVKEFENKVKEAKIEGIKKVKDHFKQIEQDKEKKKNIVKEVEETNETVVKLKKELEGKKKEQKELENSKEKENYLKLKSEEKELKEKVNNQEQIVFSYFSKLSKALRKYERVALDSKLISKYLDNSVKTFIDDKELKIKEILQGLKKSLDSLNFDDKQKKNVLELIEKSETDYLNSLIKVIEELNQEEEKLVEKINNNTIIEKIENKSKEVKQLQNQVELKESELVKFSSTLENINIENIKEKIKTGIKEVFNIEITFSSSF